MITIAVDWNSPGDTPREKIQQAIDAAPDGAQVELKFGTGFAIEMDVPIVLRKREKGILFIGTFLKKAAEWMGE
ncbi:MAG: hypothetical protein V3W28_01430 [Thermoplasmata archaeon]